MKKLFLILIACFALVLALDFNGAYAGDRDGDHGHDRDGGIPLSKLAGKYSVTFQAGGFFVQCFKPDFSATEPCSTPGAVPINVSAGTVAQSTWDKDGDTCSKLTSVFASLGQTSPPSVVVFFSVIKVTDYDPATASGDSSFTTYLGGKCIGSKFDSTGATNIGTGTYHFVASQDGERVDFTQLTSTGDFGGFIIVGTYLKQEK
jgi:hypothetical protein